MGLYNKYRPIKFEDVIQPNIVPILISHIKYNNHAAVYMFDGYTGTGKTTLARLMAMALLCKNRKEHEHNPCGECENCNYIINDNCPDVEEINCATHGGVDGVKEIIAEKIRMAPTFGNYKIFILDECHMLTPQAQNALLKIMEEPPSYVKFFLCTTDYNKVIPTIINRCQRYQLSKINNNDLKNLLLKIVMLENIKYDDKGIELIVQNANGSARTAISLLDSVSSIGATETEVLTILNKSPRTLIIELLEAIANLDRATVYKILTAAIVNNKNLTIIINDMCEILAWEIIPIKLKLIEYTNKHQDLINIINKLKGGQITLIVQNLQNTIIKIRQGSNPEHIVPVDIIHIIDQLSISK